MAARKEVRLEVACISKCQESEIATLIMNAVGGQDRSAWVTVMPILPDKDQSKISERDKARFWSMVERTNYCWNWKGGKTQDGYGQISINGKLMRTSRVAYAIINGPIINGLQALHRCDNPACVNPDHIFLGTQLENIQDMVKKGRGKLMGTSSKYHGVSFRNDSARWRAYIRINGKQKYCGSYPTEIEAAKARDLAVLKHKLINPLNFPLHAYALAGETK